MNRALAQERVREDLRRRGQPVTRQRERIIGAVFTYGKSRFTADEIHEFLCAGGERISHMTVRRTLRTLAGHGHLREMDLGEPPLVYDRDGGLAGAIRQIRCKDCGGLVEFTDPCVDLRERAVTEEMGFDADVLYLRVDAHCAEHRETGSCSRREARDGSDRAS